MGSRKRSAWQRQKSTFEAGLDGEGLADAFARECRRADELADGRDEARRTKACSSKNRYATRSDALEAIAACEAHGIRGLSCYRCRYCNGWHLTSHPQA